MIVAVAIVVMLLLFGLLLVPRVAGSTTWRATVTPLASIVGSGFLVSAPLMVSDFGGGAVAAMAALLAFAFALGHVVRFNILHAEPLLTASSRDRLLIDTDRLATVALGFAYFVSVAFYLVLLGVFVLSALGVADATLAKWLTTAILALIGGLGLFGGLHLVERVEEYAVDFNLAVIAGVSVALLLTVAGLFSAGQATWPPATGASLLGASQLFGLLIVCQGFETSRFLGDDFDAQTRARTMRLAQIIAGAIYLAFFAIVIPLFARFGGGEGVAAIIGLARGVAPIMAAVLTMGAVASQFTAATADSIASSEILDEFSSHRLRPGRAYLILVPVTIVLVWATDVRELVAYASRAFAVFYALQCAVAVRAAMLVGGGKHGRWRELAYGLLGAAALAAAILGAPSSA
jgi:hypothetical protein